MARKKKEVYHVKPLTEGKKNIISALIDEYDIETAEDIQDALRDLLGGTIKSMMEAEMSEHLGYEKSERFDSDNYRNGTKSKKVRSKYGEVEVDVPKDRNGTFEPQVVKKRQRIYLLSMILLSECMLVDSRQDRFRIRLKISTALNAVRALFRM